MRIIDFHAHIYPSAIAQKATQSICDFYGLKGDGMDGTAETLLSRGKKAGIEHFVVLPVAIKPDHVCHINDFIVDEVSKNDCITGFGTVHAAMDDITKEAERIINSGLKGVKIHPDTQRFNIDDNRLFPLYDYISDKIPVLFHTGDNRYDYSHPSRVRRVMDMFPRLRVIAAHFGGHTMYDTAYECLKDKDCLMDVSSSLMFMEEGIPEKYIHAYGADRLLFGTDFPLWDPVEEVKRFKKLKLTDTEREKIAYKNALEMLK